jgi:hypothetical protein
VLQRPRCAHASPHLLPPTAGGPWRVAARQPSIRLQRRLSGPDPAPAAAAAQSHDSQRHAWGTAVGGGPPAFMSGSPCVGHLALVFLSLPDYWSPVWRRAVLCCGHLLCSVPLCCALAYRPTRRLDCPCVPVRVCVSLTSPPLSASPPRPAIHLACSLALPRNSAQAALHFNQSSSQPGAVSAPYDAFLCPLAPQSSACLVSWLCSQQPAGWGEDKEMAMETGRADNKQGTATVVWNCVQEKGSRRRRARNCLSGDWKEKRM